MTQQFTNMATQAMQDAFKDTPAASSAKGLAGTMKKSFDAANEVLQNAVKPLKAASTRAASASKTTQPGSAASRAKTEKTKSASSTRTTRSRTSTRKPG